MRYLIFSNVLFFILIVVWAYKCFKCRSRERLTLRIIDRLAMGYFRYRVKDGVVVFANKGFVEILELGEAPEDVIGSPLEKLFIPVDPNNILHDAIKTKKEADSFTYKMKTLSGKDKIVTYRGCVVCDPVTREEIAAVLIEDITKEMEYHEKIKESLEKYEEIFKNAGDMVIMFDFISLDILEVNPAAEDLTGYSRAEILGMKLDEMAHPMDRQKLSDLSRDMAFVDKTMVEVVLICKNGFYRDVLITLTRMRHGDKNIAMAVVKDVSGYSRKKEEEAKRRKELEGFLTASVEREERVTALRCSLEDALRKIKVLEEKYGNIEKRKDRA